jgi:hypothetical protein
MKKKTFQTILFTGLLAGELLLMGCKASLQSGGAYAPAAATVSTNATNGAVSTNLVATAAPDLAFYNVDDTFWLGYSAFLTASRLEMDNRAALWAISPKIKETLDDIRPQAWQAVKTYMAARAVYKANPTPAGLPALQTALSQLQTLVSAAQAAIATATANPASPPAPAGLPTGATK